MKTFLFEEKNRLFKFQKREHFTKAWLIPHAFLMFQFVNIFSVLKTLLNDL